MATKEELSGKLDQIGEALDKVSNETTALVSEVADLKSQLENAGVDQELIDKADALLTRAQKIDELVPDATTPPDEPPPAG